MRNHIKHLLYIMVGITISACSTATKEPKAGTYEFDRLFLEKHQIEHLELMTLDGNSGILIVPAYQGRVMTSTSGEVKAEVMDGSIMHSLSLARRTHSLIPWVVKSVSGWVRKEAPIPSIFLKEKIRYLRTGRYLQ
jgi:hypothetical protein